MLSITSNNSENTGGLTKLGGTFDTNNGIKIKQWTMAIHKYDNKNTTQLIRSLHPQKAYYTSQSTNQSINQSTNQSIRQSIHQTIHPCHFRNFANYNHSRAISTMNKPIWQSCILLVQLSFNYVYMFQLHVLYNA